jgi:hypothetical protein
MSYLKSLAIVHRSPRAGSHDLFSLLVALSRLRSGDLEKGAVSNGTWKKVPVI